MNEQRAKAGGPADFFFEFKKMSTAKKVDLTFLLIYVTFFFISISFTLASNGKSLLVSLQIKQIMEVYNNN